jgi:hypothetical protein
MPGLPKFGGGARDGATDFFRLSLAYAKQETVDPIMGQVKALGRGVAGALLMAIGTALLAIGFVRALQFEFGGHGATPYNSGWFAYAPLTDKLQIRQVAALNGAPYGFMGHLSGDWSWVPYMGGALFCLLVAGFCVAKALKGVRP